MAKTITSSGTLTVADSSCSSGAGQITRDLSLGKGGAACSGEKPVSSSVCFQVAVDTQSFIDLDGLDALSEILFLYVRSSADATLRLYALPASALAVSGSFPTGYAGGETLLITIDGVLVTVTFDVADQSAAQCVARINAALALAGFVTPLASVVNGQIHVLGVETKVGAAGVGELAFAGTGAAQIGLDTGSSPTITQAQG